MFINVMLVFQAEHNILEDVGSPNGWNGSGDTGDYAQSGSDDVLRATAAGSGVKLSALVSKDGNSETRRRRLPRT